jgi:hypothetical protein
VGEEVGRLPGGGGQAVLADLPPQGLPVAVPAHPAQEHVEGGGYVAVCGGLQRRAGVAGCVRLAHGTGGLGRFEQDQAGDQARVIQRQLQPDAAA